MLDEATWRKKSQSLKTYAHIRTVLYIKMQDLFTPRLISPARMPLPSLKYDN